MSNKNQSQNPSAKGGGGGYPTACYFFAAHFEQKKVISGESKCSKRVFRGMSCTDI